MDDQPSANTTDWFKASSHVSAHKRTVWKGKSITWSSVDQLTPTSHSSFLIDAFVIATSSVCEFTHTSMHSEATPPALAFDRCHLMLTIKACSLLSFSLRGSPHMQTIASPTSFACATFGDMQTLETSKGSQKMHDCWIHHIGTYFTKAFLRISLCICLVFMQNPTSGLSHSLTLSLSFAGGSQ